MSYSVAIHEKKEELLPYRAWLELGFQRHLSLSSLSRPETMSLVLVLKELPILDHSAL